MDIIKDVARVVTVQKSLDVVFCSPLNQLRRIIEDGNDSGVSSISHIDGLNHYNQLISLDNYEQSIPIVTIVIGRFSGKLCFLIPSLYRGNILP